MRLSVVRFSIVFFLVCSIIIVSYVLFVPPRPGVADQGDFQRVMDVTGLNEKQDSIQDQNLIFYKYVKSEYIMTPINPLRLLGIIPTTSMIYPVTIAKILCRLKSSNLFNTEILAVVYAIMYITALCLCIKWIEPDSKPKHLIISVFSLIVLLDGNYLVWFNSLYGEPMMIIGMALFIASVLNISNKINTINNKDILLVVISSFLLLGAKAQCISALPSVIFIIVRIFSLKYKSLYKNKTAEFARIVLKGCLLPVALLTFYTLGIYAQINRTCGVDTKYNAVFYGVLKNSDNPKRDLQMLGLSSDMAVEAGKHAYLPKSEYEKYAPWSDITMTEFNEKISNFSIVKFYLLNPKRLIQGMEYTASQSFQTATFLGKYKKADVEEYTYLFNRFTLWSNIRGNCFPKKLWFIVSFYIAILAVTLFRYKRAQGSLIKLRIELIWAIAAIGILQFPMPFLGNGEADTAKQLFLFNYSFDILIISLVSLAAPFKKPSL